MSRFKKKGVVFKESKTLFSLAEKHNEKLQEFKRIFESIPDIKKKIATKTNQLKSCSQKEQIKIEYDIKKLKDNLASIENNKDINEYFLNNSGRLLKYFSDTGTSKASIFEDYMKSTKQQNFKGKIIKNISTSECTICNQEKILDPILSIMVCTNCANLDEIIINCDKPNFKDIPNDKSQYTYDRRHHFKELINQVQGKESTIIPESVIVLIRKEIKKYKIPIHEIKKIEMRKILKKINLTKYYEHIANILTKINPSAVIKFTKEEEDKLFYMFSCIQEPFIMYCPPDRKNLINYNYIFYKFCQILELDNSYKDYFTLLKSRYKLSQHEKIWKKIITKIQSNPVYQADDINWCFHAAI